MPQPVFPAFVAYGHDKSYVEEYTVGAAFGYGDFVVLAANVVNLCGADPAAITGLSEVVSAKATLLTPNAKVPIRVLSSEVVLCMYSPTVPVEATHLNVAYGIARDGAGNWFVDTADVVNTRLTVVRLNVAEGLWYVKMLAGNLTNDGIVS